MAEGAWPETAEARGRTAADRLPVRLATAAPTDLIVAQSNPALLTCASSKCSDED